MWRSLFAAVAVLLAACEPGKPPDHQDSVGIQIAERMAATPDPGFARALGPRAFSFPDDHGPHPAFATEWWYFTGNLRGDDGTRLGYQLTLFRIGLKPGPPDDASDWRAHQIYMGHLAVSDIDAGLHYSAERFSRAAAGLAGARARPLRVWLGAWSIEGAEAGLFPVRLHAGTPEISLDLTLIKNGKKLILQGEGGFSRKGSAAGNASYYYSFSRLPTRGTVRLGEREFRVEGNSWFDREWSSSALAPDQAGWDWFALQLDDGRDLMFYRMRDKQGHAQAFSNGVLVNADGGEQRLGPDQVQLSPTRTWRTDDGVEYPLGWRMRIPGQGLDLQIDAAFDDQEMRHTVRYWEGAVKVTGSHAGVGYLELSGYAP